MIKENRKSCDWKKNERDEKCFLADFEKRKGIIFIVECACKVCLKGIDLSLSVW